MTGPRLNVVDLHSAPFSSGFEHLHPRTKARAIVFPMSHSYSVSEVTFERLSGPDLTEWLHRTKSEYIGERMAAGDTLAEAEANADTSMDRMFPAGAPAPGQLVGRVLIHGKRVGELWIGPFGSDPARWWVWNIMVDEEVRGRGYGRKTMLLAEELARANGASSIGLNVFARNEVARSLYISLDYHETSVQMRKALDRATAPEGHR